MLVAGIVYQRNATGVSGANWYADAGNWTAIAGNGSPLGSPHQNTFFQTVRGRMAIDAGVFQARALIADSLRGGDVTIECDPVDAVFLLQPKNRIILEGIDSEYLPGGSVDAKVYSVNTDTKDGLETATIVLRASIGKGTARALSGNYVTQTGTSWDGIKWTDISDQLPVSLPSGALEDIIVTNPAADQIAYIAAHDFLSSDPDRRDPDATDPVNLVKDVPTTLEFRFRSLNGPPEMVNNIVAECVYGFAGPKQLDLEAA